MVEPDPPAKRRRRRPAKSCQQCRERKIRCDQNVPCSACVRARASLTCSYRHDDANHASGHSGQESSCSVPTFSAGIPSPRFQPTSSVLSPESATVPIRTRESVPEGAGSVSTSHPDLGGVTNLTKTTRELQQFVNHLETLLAASKQRLDRSRTPSHSGFGQRSRPLATDETSAEASQNSDICISESVPRLRNAPEKTKLFGQSHWLYTAEKFKELGKFDVMEIEPSFGPAQAELSSIVNETRALRRALKAQDSVYLSNPVSDLIGTLPTKEVCDELVRSYFRTFEPIYRIVHIPTFWKQYAHFWEQPASTSTPTHFLMKLVLILTIGTVFFQDSPESDLLGLQRLVQTWIYAAQWWLAGPSDRSTATLDGLQVFCLLILTRQSAHKCPGGPTWLSTGSLIMMARTMGLHRNPSDFPSLSPFQVQMRARLWTTVLELTCMSCLDSALPLCVSIDDIDITMPLNLDDHDLDNTETAERGANNGVTDASVQILLAKTLPLRLRVVQLLNSHRHQKSYRTALELGAELRTACREVAYFFRSSAPRPSHNETVLSPTDFHRKFVDIYLRKCIMLLHRPFMLQARNDLRFYLARKVCVESATVVGSYASNVNTNLQPALLDDLSRLFMVGRGVFKGPLSLDIIMVLALEVVTQLEEEGLCQLGPDPLDEFTEASREQLIQILERILGQLLQLIGSGSVSLKRYFYLSAYLSQIRAMESGQVVKQVVYAEMAENVKKCRALLQARLQSVRTSQQAVAVGGVAGVAMAPLTPLQMMPQEGVDDPWDVSHLLDFPLFGDANQETSAF